VSPRTKSNGLQGESIAPDIPMLKSNTVRGVDTLALIEGSVPIWEQTLTKPRGRAMPASIMIFQQ
ncbi:hypothetical protein, partial [Cupriavidus lacunae]|uniref:hypothetical protein n=1 Tax=Cupriavidus lacunae TaxID=2666307 RepID=UPI001ABF5CD4